MNALSTLFELVIELAKVAPKAIPVLLKIVRIATRSPDPVKALQRAAIAAGAKHAAREVADQVLKRSKAIR